MTIMLKQGFYTQYNGHDIEFFKDLQNNLFLRTRDKNIAKDGFTYSGRGIFIKGINSNDLGPCYKIAYKAKYHGYEFNCKLKGKSQIQLVTRDETIGKDLNFIKSEKLALFKVVLVDEVEIIESKVKIDP